MPSKVDEMLYTSGSPRSEEIAAYIRDNIGDNREFLESEELAIIIGGDGFFFKMIKELPDDTKFLPLNGGSLGYTLNDTDDLEETLRLIVTQEWKLYSFPRMTCIFRSRDREIYLDAGANDVFIERATGQTAKLNFRIDNVDMLENPVSCDGMIISTALGSTAYSLSAGGPIVHPAMKSFGITFSNPHYPRLTPMIVPGDVEIVVTVSEQEKRPVKIYCDGREVDWSGKTGRVIIEEIVLRYDSHPVSVFYLNGYCRTKQLASKFIRR